MFTSQVHSEIIREKEILYELYKSYGQEHVFAFWDELSHYEKAFLLNNLKRINICNLSNIYKHAIQNTKDQYADFTPLTKDIYNTTIDNDLNVKTWYQVGIETIMGNKVAVILLAGGQGTRLGSTFPKGCYDIGLPSHKSLFQLQAERILCLQRLAQTLKNVTDNQSCTCTITWYIMTSSATRKDTVQFFSDNNYFNLNCKDVVFFDQDDLPALTYEGKIIMSDKYVPAFSPNGNGGMYKALLDKGILEDMALRGVEYVHCYCVDNSLVKVADPVFIGYCLEKQADFAVKCVPKNDPNELVGVICMKNGYPHAVEYSELDDTLKHQRDVSGKLVFKAASIANLFYTRSFFQKIANESLKYHVAHKKVPGIDCRTGNFITPDSPNGIKLELFNFDVVKFATNFSVLEVERIDEFAPVKNREGIDSPSTARNAILEKSKRLLISAGAQVSDNVIVEVSPLTSYNGENLLHFRDFRFTEDKVV